MTRTARLASALAAVALVPLLAACGDPRLPAPGTSPSIEATPATSSTPDAGSAHTLPLATDATCDQLAPAGTFDGLFTVPIVPVGPERTVAFVSTAIDESWVVQQPGGLACDWQSAGSEVGSEGLSNYRGVRLLLVPVTDFDWNDFSAVQNDPGEDILNCGDGLCRRDVHVNGWWLSLWGYEFESEARQGAAVAAYDGIVARVTALSAPRAVTRTSSLPGGCGELVPETRLAAALGVSADSILVDDYFSSVLGDEILYRAHGLKCGIQVDGVDYAQVEALPDSAALEAAAVAAYDANAADQEELLPVPGLSEPGSFRPQAEGAGFDIVLDGDWIKIIPFSAPDGGRLEDTAVTIAGVMVAAR